MTERDWWSPEGIVNAQFVREQHAREFSALSELDALGHRILSRLVSRGSTSRLDFLVGAMLLRRAITQFVGIRHLLWGSAVDPAKLLARGLFETLLATRYLVHGGKRYITALTPSNAHTREIRSRYFMVGGIREEVYQRQAELDGVWEKKRVPTAVRDGIHREIVSRIEILSKVFPRQQKNFGEFRFEVTKNKKTKRKLYFDEKKWYSFGFPKSKPSSIQALATKFGWLPVYRLLYKPFSEMNHPVNVAHDLQIEDASVGILHPYVAEDFDTVMHWASSWQTLVLIYVAKGFHPESIPDAQRIYLEIENLMADD